MSLAESKQFIDWVAENRDCWIGEALNLNGRGFHASLLDIAVAMYFNRRNDEAYEDGLAIRDFQEWQYAADERRARCAAAHDKLVEEFVRGKPEYQQRRDVILYFAAASVKAAEPRSNTRIQRRKFE